MSRAPAGQPKESGQIQAKCSAISRGGGTPHPREAFIRLLWGDLHFADSPQPCSCLPAAEGPRTGVGVGRAGGW